MHAPYRRVSIRSASRVSGCSYLFRRHSPRFRPYRARPAAWLRSDIHPADVRLRPALVAIEQLVGSHSPGHSDTRALDLPTRTANHDGFLKLWYHLKSTGRFELLQRRTWIPVFTGMTETPRTASPGGVLIRFERLERLERLEQTFPR